MRKLAGEDLEKLVKQLVRDEGSNKDAQGRHMIYLCPAGRITIGYGHNLDANPIPGLGNIITEAQAQELLREDIFKVEQELLNKLPWTIKLDNARFAVLVNMAFNMGVAGLLDFRRALGCIHEGKYKQAGLEMLNSKWVKQVGARATRLATQMSSGVWA